MTFAFAFRRLALAAVICQRCSRRQRRGVGALQQQRSFGDAVPERPLHGARLGQQHVPPRQPAQAGRLHEHACQGRRVRRHRRDQRARRLLDAAAHHDPVHRRHRSRERHQRHHLPRQSGRHAELRGFGQRVGINQVLWDPATKTLVAADRRVAAAAFALPADRHRRRARRRQGIRPHRGDDSTSSTATRAAATSTTATCATACAAACHRNRIVAASLFTTQSITADLEKISASDQAARRPRRSIS